MDQASQTLQALWLHAVDYRDACRRCCCEGEEMSISAIKQALEALRNAEVVYMEQLNAMYALQQVIAEAEKQSPLTREWVGLESDEQILEISKDAWGKDKLNRGRDDHRSFYIAFARAVEAKLKERNT
jgi:hypothetical protein